MDAEIKTLGNVATYINGRAFKPSEWENTGLPIIRIQNLNDDSAKYNYSSVEYDERFRVEKGDLLFAWSASLGAHIWRGDSAWLNQHIFKVLPHSDVDKMYLYYYLCNVIFDLYAKTHGSGMVHITKAPFMSTPIPIPTLAKQEQIVARIEELFSQLDKGVETLQKTKQQLAVYRQAVLKQAFTSASGWVRKAASEIGEVNLGRQRSPKNVSNHYPTKYIRAANITEQGLDLDDVLDMEFTPAEREKYYLRAGDIIVSEASGSATQVGKPAIWKNEIPNCCFQNTVIRHRIHTEHPEYVFWYYKYLYESGYFSKIVGGVGINHLGAKNFANIMINIAPYDEQMEIVEQIESKMSVCDDIEKTVENAIQQTEAMRQSILKRAFEGYF